MALCKGMVLVGALLLVPTLGVRFARVNMLTPHEPEEMIKHADDHTMQKAMKKMVVHDQEELAQALVEEDVYKGPVGKVEEDAGDDVAAAVGEAVTGPGLPTNIKKETLRERMQRREKRRKMIQRKQDAGKDKESRLVKVRAGKDKETRLVKGRGNGKGKGIIISRGKGNGKGNGLIISEGTEHPDSRFRFPVWGGKWWITRLAFLHGPFDGFIYQEIPATKTLLIKAWKALQEFGGEAIIPRWCNYVGAKVGDKITFEVQEFAEEGEGKPKPVAKNIIIRQRDHAIGEGLVKGPALTDVRTQVLYYISDENLRTDKFFHDIIAQSEGGWISIDFFLECKRLKQLGASTKMIIARLRDAPGVEVRDMPGQEAIRRTSPPPPLEPGVVARQSAAHAIAKRVAEAPVLVKKMYTKQMMEGVLDLVVEKTMERMDWPTRAKQASKEWATKHKADGSVRSARSKAWVDRRARSKKAMEARKEERAMELAKKVALAKAAVKKVAAEKPAAKKMVEQGQEEKAIELAKKVALDRAAVKKADAEKPAAKKIVEQGQEEEAIELAKKRRQEYAVEKVAAEVLAAKKALALAVEGHAAAEKSAAEQADEEASAEESVDEADWEAEREEWEAAKKAGVKVGQGWAKRSATEMVAEAAAPDEAAAGQAAAEKAVKEARAATVAETGLPAATSDTRISWLSWF